MIDEMIDEIIDDSEEAYEEWEEWIDPEDIDEDSDELMHYGHYICTDTTRMVARRKPSTIRCTICYTMSRTRK